MNRARLTLGFLFHKPLFTFLSLLLLVIPLTVLNYINLFGLELRRTMVYNIATTDLILGPAGDPQQLVRGTLFFDGPMNGEMPLNKVRQIIRNRFIKMAVPLYIADNYQGFRIAGTNPNYFQMFHASLRSGGWFHDEMDVVLGYQSAATTGLKTGDTFYATHGSLADSNLHHSRPLRVSGILAKSGSALDHIILTDIRSAWTLHNRMPASRADSIQPGRPEDFFPYDFPEGDSGTLSAVLIQLNAPVSANMLIENEKDASGLQVVSPIREISGLFHTAQFSLTALGWFGLSFLVVGYLSLYARLHYFVRERSDDLFLLRTIGGTRRMNAEVIFLQGVIISDLAASMAFLLAHLSITITASNPLIKLMYGVSGLSFFWQELWMYLAVVAFGGLVSLLPSWNAYQMKIWDFLPESGGR